jgi:seryl-tRNA synthetase
VPKTYTCPLCDSTLTRDRYLQIVGVWEERKRLETSLKSEMRKLQDERVRLREENKQMRREMKQVAKDAAAKATEKERKRADKMSLLIQGKTQQIQLLTRKVKELQEQLKRGTTPQVEGLNFELELVKDLKKNFPHDVVEHHGKSGDILHVVVHKGKQVVTGSRPPRHCPHGIRQERCI